MKRSQSTVVIFTILMLSVVLTGFKVKSTSPNAMPNNDNIVIEQFNSSVLIGKWVKKDDPSTVIIFNADKTVTQITQEKTTNNTWKHINNKREVCIGTSKCIYYEATEIALFLYINGDPEVYLKPSSQEKLNASDANLKN